MATQEETDHALALLLAQDYDDYYDFDIKEKKKKKNTKEEESWGPKKPRKKKIKKIEPKVEKIVQPEPVKEQKPDKQYKTVTPGMNVGKFTDEEVELFKTGLELYGRDWTKLVRHMKTREANAIRSHCQKYFIKLFRDRIPLPAKVVETGPGYTLSGKDLDPESAAAKPYLKGMQLPYPIQSGNPLPKRDVLPVVVSIPADINVNEKQQDEKDKKSDKEKKKRGRPKQEYEDENSDLEENAPEIQTEYSKSRPVRQPKFRSDFDPISILAQQDGHVLIPCGKYAGTPGQGNGSQPFHIIIHPRVNAIMDLHAHLYVTEVIGFLAGSWDENLKTLNIKYALPCKSIETEVVLDRHYNVELDPASEVETRESIEKLNLSVVGWYHSHPTFATNPSLIDLYNQRNYQNLFRNREKVETIEPFVGAIVGPFDPQLPKSVSAINWFYVGNQQKDKNCPKQLEINVSSEYTVDDQTDNIVALIQECGMRSDQTDFAAGWRDDRWESKLDKLKNSLSYYLGGNCIDLLNLIENEISKWPEKEFEE